MYTCIESGPDSCVPLFGFLWHIWLIIIRLVLEFLQWMEKMRDFPARFRKSKATEFIWNIYCISSSRKEKRHASSRFESRNVHHTIQLIVHELMSLATPAQPNLFLKKNTWNLHGTDNWWSSVLLADPSRPWFCRPHQNSNKILGRSSIWWEVCHAISPILSSPQIVRPSSSLFRGHALSALHVARQLSNVTGPMHIR